MFSIWVSLYQQHIKKDLDVMTFKLIGQEDWFISVWRSKGYLELKMVSFLVDKLAKDMSLRKHESWV